MKHDKMQRMKHETPRMKHETPRMKHETPRMKHETPRLNTKFFARIPKRCPFKPAVTVRINDANFTLKL
jgi:hypothetical protein